MTPPHRPVSLLSNKYDSRLSRSDESLDADASVFGLKCVRDDLAVVSSDWTRLMREEEVVAASFHIKN